MTRDYLSIDDVSREELFTLLDLSAKTKTDPAGVADVLRRRSVALIFEKPSTRTRVSFEVAVAAMGGHPVVLSSTELQLGRGETIEDTG
ncbi:MAG: ornithine carbamoyltransferase, partial [Actinomycetota bacterium]